MVQTLYYIFLLSIRNFLESSFCTMVHLLYCNMLFVREHDMYSSCFLWVILWRLTCGHTVEMM